MRGLLGRVSDGWARLPGRFRCGAATIDVSFAMAEFSLAWRRWARGGACCEGAGQGAEGSPFGSLVARSSYEW